VPTSSHVSTFDRLVAQVHREWAQVPDPVQFVIIWAVLTLLLVAAEVGGLYFLDALR